MNLIGKLTSLLNYSGHASSLDPVRRSIAARYLRGSGIEIGALHEPLTVPAGVHVSYVERLPEQILRRHYPELAGNTFVKADILDDGERLQKLQDSTQDFVITNHFLEHCVNPLEAMYNFFRILKSQGILYLAIPDKRYTFDSKRSVTSLHHVLEECGKNPELYRRQHFEEWVTLVDQVSEPEQIQKRVNELMEMDYSIHYHVWTQVEMFEFLNRLRSVLGFEFEHFTKNGIECIFVLRKNSPSQETTTDWESLL